MLAGASAKDVRILRKVLKFRIAESLLCLRVSGATCVPDLAAGSHLSSSQVVSCPDRLHQLRV